MWNIHKFKKAKGNDKKKKKMGKNMKNLMIYQKFNKVILCGNIDLFYKNMNNHNKRKEIMKW